VSIKEVWVEHPLTDVLRFYADAFKAKKGQEILRREYFVDTVKGVVLFKIVTVEATTPATRSCPKCNAKALPPGSYCKGIDCPLNPNQKAKA
jgi:hypothetical protein